MGRREAPHSSPLEGTQLSWDTPQGTNFRTGSLAASAMDHGYHSMPGASFHLVRRSSLSCLITSETSPHPLDSGFLLTRTLVDTRLQRSDFHFLSPALAQSHASARWPPPAPYPHCVSLAVCATSHWAVSFWKARAASPWLSQPGARGHGGGPSFRKWRSLPPGPPSPAEGAAAAMLLVSSAIQ